MPQHWRTNLLIQHTGSRKAAEENGAKLVAYAESQGFQVASATTAAVEQEPIQHPVGPPPEE